MVVARGWWRGDGELMFDEYRVPVLEKKKKRVLQVVMFTQQFECT